MLVSGLSLVYQETKGLTALGFYSDTHQKYQLTLLKLFMRQYTGSISALSKMSNVKANGEFTFTLFVIQIN